MDEEKLNEFLLLLLLVKLLHLNSEVSVVALLFINSRKVRSGKISSRSDCYRSGYDYD